ncbi:TyeA family type III secretion system gatekeeper subunit [Bremerella sp. JC770]|uniref:TyeA family type III secretion system gatekeeper subunit n=1 Tax=Bremerella sp. JC770 TaxID=3232137 RepID=UPI00345ADB5B
MQSTKQIQNTEAIIREVLPLRNKRRIDPRKFTDLVDRLGIDEIEAKIYFLRELAGIVRNLPVKIFDLAEDRLRLIEAIQDALDEAIDLEEETIE